MSKKNQRKERERERKREKRARERNREREVNRQTDRGEKYKNLKTTKPAKKLVRQLAVATNMASLNTMAC